MKFTAQQIAGILEGDVVGNPDIEVSKLAKIEEGFEGALTFLANGLFFIKPPNRSFSTFNQ